MYPPPLKKDLLIGYAVILWEFYQLAIHFIKIHCSLFAFYQLFHMLGYIIIVFVFIDEHTMQYMRDFGLIL